MDIQPLALVAAATMLLGTTTDPDAAFKAGNFDAAQAAYAQQVSAQPTNVDALIGLATTELYKNDLAASKREVQRALKLDPQNARAKRLARTVDMRIGKSGSFQVAQSGDAIFPFVGEDPMPIIEMNVNGVKARIMIDTGAPIFVVMGAFAKEHNLKVTDAGMGTFAGGKHAPIQETSIESISAGPLTVRNVAADVMPGLGLTTPIGRIDGIIGTTFFTHFLTTLDYPHHRLILRPATATAPTQSVATVPMWLVGDHFIFAKGSVNDGSSSTFLVDSGADFAVQLTKPSLDAAHLVADGTPQPFTGGGGDTKVIPFHVPSLAIGNARQANVEGVFFPEGDPFGSFPFTVAGAISGGFLKHYALTLDFKSMRLSLN